MSHHWGWVERKGPEPVRGAGVELWDLAREPEHSLLLRTLLQKAAWKEPQNSGEPVHFTKWRDPFLTEWSLGSTLWTVSFTLTISASLSQTSHGPLNLEVQLTSCPSGSALSPPGPGLGSALPPLLVAEQNLASSRGAEGQLLIKEGTPVKRSINSSGFPGISQIGKTHARNPHWSLANWDCRSP